MPDPESTPSKKQLSEMGFAILREPPVRQFRAQDRNNKREGQSRPPVKEIVVMNENVSKANGNNVNGVNGVNKAPEPVSDLAWETAELRKEMSGLTGELRQMRTLKSTAISAASTGFITAIAVAAGYGTIRGIRALLAPRAIG